MAARGDTQAQPPGWHASPDGGARYWDGKRWGAAWAPYPASSGRALQSQPTTAAALSHFGFVLCGFLLPLIIYLLTDNSDEFTKTHATEALNFQLTNLIVGVIGGFAAGLVLVVTFGLLGWIIVPLIVIWLVLQIVWCLSGAVAAHRHLLYSYPVCLRLVPYPAARRSI
jgi:hypothetical protein